MTLQQFLSYVDYMMDTTANLFQQVPPEKIDWKPTNSSFTVGQQMAHIVGAIDIYAGGITKGEWGFTSMRERFLMNRRAPSMTADEALAQLNIQRASFRARVGALSEAEFAGGEVASPQMGGLFPRWRVALLFIEHHLNHKAELFMYLKMLGIKVNTGHLYRGAS